MPGLSVKRKWSRLILVLAMLYVMLTPAGANVLAEKQTLLVGFRVSPGSAELQLIRELGGKVTREFSIVPAVQIELPANAVAALARNPRVDYIESDLEVRVVMQSTPWGINRIMAPEAWQQTEGHGVTVAVLDTGIGSHSDLPIVLKATNTVDGSGNGDGNGHGTHVAGIIAALNNTVGVVGAAPKAGLYSVKVLDDSGTGTVSDVVAGIEWAVSQGANIITMSFGSATGSQTLESACSAAYRQGVLLVAAAGNNGNSFGIGDNVAYPAKYSSVIAVAAFDSYNQRADFSSTGPAVELAAPGVDIFSTSTQDSYTHSSGTSMAAPHVAGTAALVWSANPSLTNTEVRSLLQETAQDLEVSPTFQGYGLVRADLAVAAAPAGPADPIDSEEDSGSDGDSPVVRISASSSFIHDSFGTNANSCRNCHIFHAAPADELLKTGPSQTQFCYLCHGNGAASSPYDVQGGVIAGMAESSAGGFDTVGGHVYNAVPVTSRHMVDGYVDNTSAFAAGSAALGFTGVIPGSNSKTVTADLVCSSCHNPHAGGASAPNPRLLRTVIMEVYDLYVTVDTQAVSDPDLLTGYQANRITGYRSGFNKWCSSCHDVLARATGSGHTADGSGLFRHATNVTATVYAPYNTTTGQGIPLEGATTSGNSSTGLVTCMTCHRSHGSTVQMSVFANRFERLDNAGGVADPVYSSALLRMDNRSVCYSCHGAAAFNIPVY